MNRFSKTLYIFSFTLVFTVMCTHPGFGDVALKVNIKAGPHFRQSAAMGNSRFQVTPQIVIWYEQGTKRETLWMTRKFAQQKWGFRHDYTKVFRPSTFPVWMDRFPADIPTRNNPLPDAVTGASPQGDVNIALKIPAAGQISLFVEVNNSFDNNKAFPLGSDYNGQPSVIYVGELDLNKAGTYPLVLKYTSTSQGKLSGNLSGITSAREILEQIVVTVP